MKSNSKTWMSLKGIVLPGPWHIFPPDSGTWVKRRCEGLGQADLLRVIFMAFWTEIWKLQIPLWHFFLKHMITPDKDLEAKFWGWEVVCPLWVGRNFSDGGKWGHRSGTGSWYFGDTPLLFLPGSFLHSLPNHSDPESTQEGMSHLVSLWGSLLKESRFLGTSQSWG